MTMFNVVGKEMIIKVAVKHGGGAMVYVPKKWIGERIGIIRDVE